MSIIFGIKKPEGNLVQERQLLDLAHATGRWAPDGTFVRVKGRIGMGLQPYHTHTRSKLDSEPISDEFGNVVAIDGRLDNHQQLRELLGIQDPDASDSSIVIAAFRRWGEDCFSRLVGDWALAVWSYADRTLYLARDHAGARTLYYEERAGQLIWSTYLETFFFDTVSRELDDTYAACYIARRPIYNLTPYKGVRSVPPAHYVAFTQSIDIKPHWTCAVRNRLNYKTDAEYEEHFLALFRQSIERRVGNDDHILAHLSGGMDSSSIVCMSDSIRRQHGATADQLVDTISFYDNSEPGWDERPYFTLIEAKRNKPGVHLELSFGGHRYDYLNEQVICWLPGVDNHSIEQEQRLEDAIGASGYRVIISGLGGDELLGGVPTPLPELADLLISAKINDLWERTLNYCLLDRTPVVHLLGRTVRHLMDIYGFVAPTELSAPQWLHPRVKGLLESHRTQNSVIDRRYRFKPSTVDTCLTWWSMLESLPHKFPGLLSRREYRYPYLDRDLVEFLISVPRSQMVQPGRRRALMRRALRHIVPDEVIERRRKAALLHGPLDSLQRGSSAIERLIEGSVLEDLQLIDTDSFRIHLASIRSGSPPPGWIAVLRVVAFEIWFHAMRSRLNPIIRVP